MKPSRPRRTRIADGFRIGRSLPAVVGQPEIELAIVYVRVHLVPLFDGFDVDRAYLVILGAQIADQMSSDEPSGTADHDLAHASLQAEKFPTLTVRQAPWMAPGCRDFHRQPAQ